MSSPRKPGRTAAGPVLAKKDYEALAAFRYMLRKFLHFSEAAAEQEGLTAQHHQALLAIQGFPGRDVVTVGELAERLQLKHHSVVGLADRLVERGLVKRRASQEDRRIVHLSLTARGLAILERLALAHQQELRKLTPQLKVQLRILSGSLPRKSG